MSHLDSITGQIVDAAITVHRALGPGLLESAYEACLLHELQKRKMKALSQVMLPVYYDNTKIDAGYRIDLLVEDAVVLELKSVAQVLPIHEAQLLSYLRLGDFRVGFLLNFNVIQMKDGIKRMVNNY